MQSRDEAGVRLDKWLWAARFFKTRVLATEAINGGHVHLNGARVRPAKLLQQGDQIAIRKGPYEFNIIVKGLTQRRGPAKDAAELYEETTESREARERLAEERRLQAAGAAAPQRRPDKRARRRIIRFTNKA